jgi:hypothetical protein
MNREELGKSVKKLEKQLFVQVQLTVSLMQKIEQQEKELLFYRDRKNSNNSSPPLSLDLFRVRRTESFQESSDKKPGDQAGHKTLQLRSCYAGQLSFGSSFERMLWNEI